MNSADIRAKKIDLEKEIKNLINNFESETDTSVESVDVTTGNFLSDELPSRVIDIKVSVKI